MVKRVGRPRSTEKIGAKFGRLTVLEAAYKDQLPAWKCLCECGTEHVVKDRDLRGTKSCGCLRVDMGKANKTHGMLGTKTYDAWHGMKQRCFNPANKAWKNYGGRGITVCDRWKDSFEFFLQDMGESPVGKSLDRIDNSKGYSPENCRWADNQTQARNKRSNVRFDIGDGPMTLSEIAERSGLSVQVLSWRIYKMGMSPKEACETPPLRRRKK